MAIEIPPYSGYRPHGMRAGRASSDSLANRNGKRSRLSKSKADRVLYCSPKGYKQNPRRYAELSAIADKLNGRYVRPVETPDAPVQPLRSV
jgi:hypothetical protein